MARKDGSIVSSNLIGTLIFVSQTEEMFNTVVYIHSFDLLHFSLLKLRN